MADLIFYQQVASLDKEKHGKLRLAQNRSLDFSRETNSVPLVAGEFVEAAREFPIGFVQAGDQSFLPVALLGLRKSENLFVKADGQWNGRYLPAFIRRYPFAPLEAGDGQMLVCVDEKAACLSEEGDGVQLFAENGPSPVLTEMLTLLQEYQAQALRTQVFCQRLVECNLLVESDAHAKLGDGSDFFSLSGLYVVDQNRLQALTAEQVLAFFSAGEWGLIYAHLLSLGNIQQLAERLATRLSH